MVCQHYSNGPHVGRHAGVCKGGKERLFLLCVVAHVRKVLRKVDHLHQDGLGNLLAALQHLYGGAHGLCHLFDEVVVSAQRRSRHVRTDAGCRGYISSRPHGAATGWQSGTRACATRPPNAVAVAATAVAVAIATIPRSNVIGQYDVIAKAPCRPQRHLGRA